MNSFRFNRTILTSGGSILALALVLFAASFALNDFGGAGLFGGRSKILLVLGFGLLFGLGLFLLLRLSRAGAAQVPAGGMEPRAAAGSAAVAVEPAAVSEQAEGQTEILSDAAEELRTTVDVIQEELEEILDDDVPADKEHLQLLYDETDRLKRIIDSMEQLSQVQEIARLNRRELLPVEPLLQDVVAGAKEALPDRNIAYGIECEPGLVMQGDPECLRRIIGNLTDNAARSLRGAGTVTIAAGRSGGAVVFTVADTGTGIRRAHLPHIYERFFRGTGSGIGMGLSIVKELVDAFGGTIEVRTAANKGTTFTVSLPAE